MNGKMKELKLGIAAGARLTLTTADLPSLGGVFTVTGVKVEKGVIKVRLGDKKIRQNSRWQPLGPGDFVRCSGEFGPVYTFEALSR